MTTQELDLITGLTPDFFDDKYDDSWYKRMDKIFQIGDNGGRLIWNDMIDASEILYDFLIKNPEIVKRYNGHIDTAIKDVYRGRLSRLGIEAMAEQVRMRIFVIPTPQGKTGGIDVEEKNRGQKEIQDQVVRQGLCTGCGACVGLCPYQACYEDRIVFRFLRSCRCPKGGVPGVDERQGARRNDGRGGQGHRSPQGTPD